MKVSNLIKTTSYLILIVSIISCASKKQVTTEDSIATEEPIVIPTPKILFLSYQLVKNAQNEKNIALLNQIKTEGKLKGKPKKIENTTLGDLEYILLDKDFKEVEKHALKNPLNKTVEFINDFGNFEKRVLDLDSVQFNLRLQLPTKAKHIVITEITNTEPIKHISTKID